MNKKRYILVVGIILIGIVSLIILNNKLDNKETKLDEVKLKENKASKKSFAIMIQKEDGTGYDVYEENTWPTNMVYNNELSGCIDNYGNIIEDSLLFDIETNIATVETGVTSSCYLYFDIDKTFAIYSDTDNSLRFYNNNDYKTIENQDLYNNLAVTSIYKNFIKEIYYWDSETGKISTPWFEKNENITSIYIEDIIKPINLNSWFDCLLNVTYINVENLDVQYATSLQSVFSYTGSNSKIFKIIGLEDWNTRNITNMHTMFNYTGYNATEWSIGDLSNWDTSNVTTMQAMFSGAGYSATEWSIGNLSNWNTKKVTEMYRMFYQAGYNATYLLDLSRWQVPLVTSYGEFESYVEDKIIAPNWGN